MVTVSIRKFGIIVLVLNRIKNNRINYSIWFKISNIHTAQVKCNWNIWFLADRTNGRAIDTLLRMSSVFWRLWRYVLWLNGAY